MWLVVFFISATLQQFCDLRAAWYRRHHEVDFVCCDGLAGVAAVVALQASGKFVDLR